MICSSSDFMASIWCGIDMKPWRHEIVVRNACAMARNPVKYDDVHSMVPWRREIFVRNGP